MSAPRSDHFHGDELDARQHIRRPINLTDRERQVWAPLALIRLHHPTFLATLDPAPMLPL